METRDLSFLPGVKLQDEIRRLFEVPVTSVNSAGSFALVVSFGRCKLRLTPVQVSFILQATIGGYADHFIVSQLAPRVFKFFVFSRDVGFFVRRLVSFECEEYKLFLHLWGHGGPNWRAEYLSFCKEEENSWTHIPSSSGHASSSLCKPGFSFADAARMPALNPLPTSGANAVPIKPVTGVNRVPLGQRLNQK